MIIDFYDNEQYYLTKGKNDEEMKLSFYGNDSLDFIQPLEDLERENVLDVINIITTLLTDAKWKKIKNE